MAPSAKIAFQDIGDEYGNLGVLGELSLYDDLFTQAYTAGARVHTNSWGGGADYNYMSFEVDKYTSDHPDFLVLFAAGNGGNMYSVPEVGYPGNAKNSLTVGSGQIRDQYTDQMFDTTTMSSFSSNGPTLAGRMKPGELIISSSNILFNILY
jgi:serine protease AprX